MRLPVPWTAFSIVSVRFFQNVDHVAIVHLRSGSQMYGREPRTLRAYFQELAATETRG
jgi:hypothetical protein